MDKFGIGFIKNATAPIRRGWIRYFGSGVRAGDKNFFDQRGAIHIKHGEKGISDSGDGYIANDPVAIYKPTGSKTIDATKAMNSNFGWVYACVKAISDEMSGIEYRLFEINSKGEHTEVTEHEVLDLLDGVNERQTGPEFKKTLAAHLELTGNAYIVLMGKKDKVQTFEEQPMAMYLLNPGATKVMLDKTTFPYQVREYVMKDDNRTYRFAPHQIVHLKYPDPSNPFDGMGTVDGIAEWIDNDNYAMEFNRNFFKNGARLSGFFKTDYATVEQAMRLKISFDEQFAGVKNAYKTMIMPKGVEFTPAQASSKDMDFNSLLEMTADRIRAGFRVSKTILGAAESETNRATAETADYVFAKRTIKPKMEMIVSYLNEFLIPRYGDNLYLSFNDPVQDDKTSKSAEMSKAVAGRQVMTQNEAREEYMGLGPVDDPEADMLSFAPPSPSGEVAPPDNTKSKKGKSVKVTRAERLAPKASKFVRYSTHGKRKAVKTQFSRNRDIRKEMAKGLAEGIKSFLEGVNKKSVADMSDDEYIAAIYIHQKSRMDDFVPLLHEKLKELNKKQEKEVLKNLSKAIKEFLIVSRKEITPSKLFNMDEWINLSIDLLTPLMTDFYSKEAESALRNIGGKPTDILTINTAKHAIDKRIALLAESYNKTILDTLTSKLNEGLTAGDSLAELTAKVSDVYAWSEEYQAARVAKTETVAISNMANKEAWKAAGTVKSVKWYTSEKENVCPSCMAMKGKEIPIDENFYNKGDIIDGTDGMVTADYSAIGGPPLHPNCGCFIRPASFSPINID